MKRKLERKISIQLTNNAKAHSDIYIYNLDVTVYDFRIFFN